MTNPTTEAKIVDALMEELREIGPLANELDSLHDEEDAALRASLADRVHEHVERYRTSERSLRAIVKSLAEQNDQTPVRAEVFFGERMLSVTISMPTLTPEAEARLGQPIVDTIRGLLGLTGTVKSVSFGTDVEDASPGDQREHPGRAAAPSGGEAAHDVRTSGRAQPATGVPESEALVLRLLLGDGKLPGNGVRFMYCGQRQDFNAGWARKVYFDTEIGGWAVLFSDPMVPTSSFRVSQIREISSYPDERLCEFPESSEAFYRKLELLVPGADISFMYRGEEHKARVLTIVRRRTASESPYALHTVDGSVYDVKAISDVRPV